MSAFIQMSLQNKYFGVYLHSQKGTKRGRAEKKRGGGRERERGRSEKGKEDDRLQWKYSSIAQLVRAPDC